jgi:hypothetical protein
MKMPIACAVVLALTCSVSSGQQPSGKTHDSTIAGVSVHDTVASLQELIRDKYFDTNVIPRIEVALAAAERQGVYANARDLGDLSAKLNETLDQVTHDKHLFVQISEAASTDLRLPRAERARMENYGIKQAEVLDGNVGYLQMTAFYRPNEAAEALETAMKFLSHTDALILDFRNNGGGSPDTVAQLLSYFYKQPNSPLFTTVPRFGEPTIYNSQVSGVAYRDESRPLYVLVSGSTGSGGEGVPFILQACHRATIIGEKTMGAANVARPWPVNSSLSVTIPVAHLEIALNKTNWERTGVIPDITVTPNKALGVAYVDALGRLMESTTDTVKRKVLDNALSAARASSMPAVPGSTGN